MDFETNVHSKPAFYIKGGKNQFVCGQTYKKIMNKRYIKDGHQDMCNLPLLRTSRRIFQVKWGLNLMAGKYIYQVVGGLFT